MKIMIAVPCMDQCPTPFVKALASLRKIGDCTLVMQSGSLVYTSRNDISQLAIREEYDYVLWLDSDMVFPPDTLEYMMQVLTDNDLDILTGLYFRRVPPYTPVLFDQLDIVDGVCYWSDFKDGVPDKLFKVGGCGFGCVLMRTDVFFDVKGRFGNFFAPIAGAGEDLAFCWRARQCGYEIYCDPRVECGHVGYATIDRKFYEAYRGAKNGS